MVKGGAKKSLTAAPSRRNSGLKQSPRPLPISRPTMASSLGATRSSVVLGATVERTTTLCASFLRSEEHTSELQSLMRISYAVFCLKKKKRTQQGSIHLCTMKHN